MKKFFTINLYLYVYAYTLFGVKNAGAQEKDSDLEPLILDATQISILDTLSLKNTLVTDEEILKCAAEPTVSTTQLIFACPPREDLRDIMNRLIKQVPRYDYIKYCLFETGFQKNKGKKKKCDSPVPPELTRDPNPLQNQTQCHTNKSDRYTFGFRYCDDISNINMSANTAPKGGVLELFGKNEQKFSDIPSELPTQILRMYGICYSSEEKNTIWTQHTIQSPLLFDEKIPDEVNDDLELSTEDFGILDKNHYQKMHKAFAKQKQDSKDYMVPQMLVPKEEMAKQPWQTTTLHYINIKPLWKQLRQLMNVINHTIRRVAAGIKRRGRGQLEIKTTAYNVDSTKRTRLYLNNSKSFPIPDIWCKLVRYYDSKSGGHNKSILIYIHNTPREPNKIPKQCEEQIQCDFKKWSIDTLTEEQTKYAYCCQPSNNLLQAFFPPSGAPNGEDLLDLENWLKDNHALAVIAPRDVDLIAPLQSIYDYEVADDAGTLANGTSSYAPSDEEQLLYLCPAENEIQEAIKTFSCYYPTSKCLFVKRFQPHEPKRCKNLVLAELEEVLTESRKQQKCLNQEAHFLYSMGYKLCGTLEYVKETLKNWNPEMHAHFNVRFIHSFYICYNQNQDRTVWTYHKIKSPRVQNLPYNDNQDADGMRNEDFEYTQAGAFKEVELFYQLQEENAPNYMVPHLMVPKEDKPSEQWKKITSHYINTAPLSIKLEPLMNLIEERIGKLADHVLPIYVYTGIFNLTDEVARKSSLPNSVGVSTKKVIVPDFWCKLVVHKIENQYEGIAIYLHNTPNEPPQDILCREKLGCDFKRWSEESSVSPEIPDDLIQYAYCCTIDKYSLNLFKENVQIVGDLDLNDLAKNNKKN